ncbi:VWA domain-containing protein, partial [Hellea sp.]|nr:VWA domain-containing protein [Hellea sp.]
MFQKFFKELRSAKIPVSIREYLTLLEGVDKNVANDSLNEFYYLSRTTLVKDERDLDKFDQVFSHIFRGIDYLSDIFGQEDHEIPADWLRALAEANLTPEEMVEIESLGDFNKIMEALKERLENQDKRHEGGNKNIGTAGKSPFGAYGYNPEGIRIGQREGRHGKAVK